MTAANRKRPRLGDVVKITTMDGYALAQFTHKHPEFGALVRVFRRAEILSGPKAGEIAVRPVQFSAFFPLGAACNRGIAQIIGNASVRPELQSFPKFRIARSLDPRHVGDRWWLWDGGREWHVGFVTTDQLDLPLQEIVNDTLLVQRALAGWRHSDDRR